MGVVSYMDCDNYPTQGSWLNKRVKVCFNYDTSKVLTGTIVRDDTSVEGTVIIKTDCGRYILSTECQYSLLQQSVLEDIPEDIFAAERKITQWFRSNNMEKWQFGNIQSRED